MSTQILQAPDTEQRPAHQPAIKLSYRPLTEADVIEMSQLHAVAYRDSGVSASGQLELFWKEAYGPLLQTATLGAWHHNILVGVIIVLDKAPDEWCSPEGGEAPFIADIFVDPEYRRQGVAAALIMRASAAVAALGRDALTLQLDIEAAPEVVKLYDYLGFTTR